MKEKRNRLDVVRSILSEMDITSQEDLLNELSRQGFKLTQATLSRDLKLLKAAKISNRSGQYIYALPGNPYYKRAGEGSMAHHRGVHRSEFRSIKFSGNLAVIHTRPGYASALAAEIDTIPLSQSIGTIAGDDTILLIMAEGVTSTELVNGLRVVVPQIKEEIR